MVFSTDDYQTQPGQLADYLLTRREAIVNQWQATCVLDKDPATRTNVTSETLPDQLLALLTMFTERIRGQPQQSELVERAGQHGLHQWQRGYTLTKLLRELNCFFDVLAEEIQQFLTLYPQTQPQVIAQAQAQLLQLARDASLSSVFSVEQWQQTTAAGPIQPHQSMLNSLHPLTKQQLDHLRQTSHDLRSYFGILSAAADLLQQPLTDGERAKYMDMLSRNVKLVQHLLNQLLDYAQVETEVSKPVDATNP